MKKYVSILVTMLVLFVTLPGIGSSALEKNKNLSSGEPVNIKVMSYNIHHAVGEDGELNLDRIAEVIKNTDSDIIGLQEVDNHWSSRSDFQDQAKLLAERLDMFYIYAANLNYESSEEGVPNRQYGTAILSEYPFLDGFNHLLPKIGDTEQRGLFEAVINVKGTQLHLYNTHLALTPEERKIQIREIVDIAGGAQGPQIIMGDLNALPSSEAMKPLYSHYSDAFEGHEDAYTYSATNPTKRINYIFTSNDLETKQAQVINTLASDHLPITTEITLYRSQPYQNGNK
ncbi:endonuclease/exonuclease/phosphatase family protein [Thalassobacillus pellis]|uniref:endonuclease/exonuclease/phosphatase family protein n=1 Tax=Thalassobacillus pellis TaxID=748008 RepID=UPI001960DFB9|nr:endonuclease/exonuclease/phosphatase family protein [Thalassobacillus pellis]MBM7553197.1 endonuclease/exonuclease/phosphatase family metal-dependent hydrolase [Thalassobacillus pellis]